MGITGILLTTRILSACSVNKIGMADVMVFVPLCSNSSALVSCFLADVQIDEVWLLFQCLQSTTMACVESIQSTSISYRVFLNRTFICVVYPNLCSTSEVKASKSPMLMQSTFFRCRIQFAMPVARSSTYQMERML